MLCELLEKKKGLTVEIGIFPHNSKREYNFKVWLSIKNFSFFGTPLCPIAVCDSKLRNEDGLSVLALPLE